MHVTYIVIDHRIGNIFPAPCYATEGAAGTDLIACIDAPLTLEAGETHLIPSGIAIALPQADMVAKIYPRSGLGHKHGIVLGNSVGIIDADYRGQIFVSLRNQSQKSYTITPGVRIAQLVIMPIYRPIWQHVDSLPDTTRGSGGFGSTGS
jgi:dUTP pyrophosphatase